ncbi:MAG: kelch repeat-containing protein [Acidobacteriota bacterium]
MANSGWTLTSRSKEEAVIRVHIGLAGALIVGGSMILAAGMANAGAAAINWELKTPAASPPARYQHSMAYDAARGQLVLFGGYAHPAALGDTWVWDGSNWTQKSPPSWPSARFTHAMAYDAARGQVVLFGGYDGASSFNDTWVWDGSTWTQKTPAASPPARFLHAMTYDAARGQVVLFGGHESGFLADTWVWDGSNWAQKKGPTPGPSARCGHAIAYDAARSQVVLFGGEDGGSRLNDTWVWNGSTWTQKTTASPAIRNNHAMAYDGARGEVVLFGGGGQTYLGDTWAWDGSAWNQENPAASPSARYQHAMAYDAARGRLVLFGGWDGSAYRDDTWVTSASCGTITVAPAGMPGAIAGQFFQETVSATGGNAPYGYAMTAGTPPPGMGFDTVTGVLSGTCGAAGDYSFTITATDSWGCTGSRVYTLTVSSGCVQPFIILQPTSKTVVSGQQVLIEVITGGTDPMNFQWYEGASGDTGAPVSGAITDLLLTPALTTTTNYWLRIGNTCGTVDSATITVTVTSAGPTITRIKSKTSKPGSSATIYGAGFSATPSQNTVYFGKKKAAVKKARATSLQVTIPSKAKKGSVGVYVVVNGKNSNTVQFTVK